MYFQLEFPSHREKRIRGYYNNAKSRGRAREFQRSICQKYFYTIFISIAGGPTSNISISNLSELQGEQRGRLHLARVQTRAAVSLCFSCCCCATRESREKEKWGKRARGRGSSTGDRMRERLCALTRKAGGAPASSASERGRSRWGRIKIFR